MGTNHDNAAETYATHNATYLRYLSSIRKDWAEAEVLSRHLESAATCIPKLSDECVLEGETTTIAQVLDMSVFTDGQGNTTNEATVTSTLGRHLVRPPPREVARFLRDLQSCKPHVGTRIVVLHRQWGCTNNDKAADTLLFCHILGMELDLRPSEVNILARIVDLENEVVSLRRRPQRAGFVSLGSMDDLHSNSVAAWLGVRDFQGVPANLVVMCLHERRFPWDGPTYPRSDELSRPSLPSCSKGTRRYKLDAEAKDLFTRALNHSLDAGFVPKNDMPDGYWLAALIHLEAINCADWLDHINAQRSSVGHDAVTKEPQQLSDQMSELCKTLQSDISQVVALRKTPSVLVRSADYEEDLLMLDRLLREAMVIASDMRELLDLQHRAKNTQVAELAINESRSAIAVTVLAFVFIPINLASSVYGMNVQEINETGHSIWGFLVTASVLLTMSGLAWMGWRASRNWGVILDERWRALPATHHTCWQAGNLYWRMYDASERFKRKDFAVYIGLRSVEKRKHSAV